MYDAFGRGDTATILSTCDPAIEWSSLGSEKDFPTLGARRGIAGVAEFFRLVAEHNSFTSFEPQAFHVAGDTVFVEGHYGITAKRTGRHFESDWLHSFTVKNGKVLRFREYADSAAFAAAYRS
jgi:ketosteroid isomerase-like protein